jgi:hypothetical protein
MAQSANNSKETAKTCFVIMPFSRSVSKRDADYWSNHFKQFIVPLCQPYGVEVSRSSPTHENILREIIHRLVYSDIVIADLTDCNPNVFWELGIRQSFRHCTITIKNETCKRKIPFDVSGKMVLKYSKADINKFSFKELFDKAMIECLKNPKRPDSEVLESVTGRTSIYQVIHQEEIKQKIESLIAENLYNYSIFEHMIKITDENQGTRKKNRWRIKDLATYVNLAHLSNAAINQLLAERYLEEDKEFYKKALNIQSVISILNQNIFTWQTARDSVESYIREHSNMLNYFEEFQKDLFNIQEKAKKWC